MKTQATKPPKSPRQPVYACTECGGDAFIAYGSSKQDSWDGKVKKGERLCTKCFRRRGGQPFF